MEDIASISCGGFDRQDISEVIGRLEHGCGVLCVSFFPLLLQVTN